MNNYYEMKAKSQLVKEYFEYLEMCKEHGIRYISLNEFVKAGELK